MHLSVADGKYSVKNTSEADRRATLGMRANNDPSEGMFGCLSEAFQKCKGAGMAELAGEGQIHFNGDMRRGTCVYMTSKRRKAECKSQV